MKMTIETFVSMLIIAIGVLVFGQLVNEHAQINEARNYHAEIIDRLESSYFNKSVVNDIKDEIEELNESAGKNYSLYLTETTTTGDDSVTIYDEYKIIKVKLNFTVSIPLFGVIDEGVISGYAR